jgi:hypothetical protein
MTITKLINSIAAIHAAKLLENLLGQFYNVLSVEFIAKVKHTEADKRKRYTTMLTCKNGNIEVLTKEEGAADESTR